ncbi:MAG: 4-hydroxy-tetrahydrodipicolinate reductase [Flavobacteriales bacterium]|nr:4-hydroxy-tetrahydrodipicolinate reductase [Flavobacteriales bacterium]|tara:strand:- start:18619 stop:19332 length:714 start_codon:yes stop_codon:yes gene_type:complete
MKIAILGYGKMGKEIEKIALSRGNDVVLKIGEDNLSDLTKENLSLADVAIEFSTPNTAYDNIQLCFESNVPVVVGTTGWLDKIDYCIQQTEAGKGLFYASNFSVGVNVFFEINKKLASLMAPYKEYKVAMEEVHHTEKLDSPSGTAITLAEGIIDNLPQVTNWVNEKTASNGELGIFSKRIENVPGTHIVTYENDIDEIYIKHTAHNRKGFALGAVLAAEFMYKKSGFFGMSDLLGL